MIFEPDDVIERGETMFHSFRILYGEEKSYRQVYYAIEGTLFDSNEKMVSLIVYNLDELPPDYALAPSHERDILKKVEGGYFPKYRGYFEYERQGHKYYIVITENYWSSTLRELISDPGGYCHDSARAELVACVINGIRSMTEQLGKVYIYDLSPDNILCYFSGDGKVGIRFANLNLIRLGPDDEYKVDIDLLPRDFCAPETIVDRFQESTMQWGLAALAVYVLNRRHPYGLPENIGLYDAYLRYKNRPKPDVNICEGINYSLRRALSIGVSYRLESLEKLMDDLLQFLSSFCRRPNSKGNNPGFNPSLVNTRNRLDPQSLEDKQGDTSPQDSVFMNESPFESISNDIPVATQTDKETLDYVNFLTNSEARFTLLKGDGFKGIAGYEELKGQLTVDFINVVNNLDMAKRYGIRPPCMLFFGAPGTGKTYIAEHLGQELGIEVSIIRPSTLGSIYVHGSQQLISDLFKQAERKAKANSKGVLLVFDEVDAMTQTRVPSDHNHIADEVAEFLTQLNNCSERGVFVIGTTNSIERIDPAIMRKGRLDKIIFFDLPDAETRRKILEYEINKLPHATNLDLDKLAVMSEGFTSSDISFIVGECARKMFSRSLEQGSDIPLDITQEVLEQTILDTRPSVSSADRIHYRKMYDKYVNARTQATASPRIGFNTLN